MSGFVLSLCDRTGNMVKPWLDAGYRAITIDLQPSPWQHPLRQHMIADVTQWRLADIRQWHSSLFPPVIVFAFPPCTDLAVSGARWFKEKGLSALIHALEVVEACREICEDSGAPYMIENPVSTLSTYWREPDFSFDPCDYGDPYTKRTCLWTGGGFVMPERVRANDLFVAATCVEPVLGSMMHLCPPSPDRPDLRSVTPGGFAEAVFRANNKEH